MSYPSGIPDSADVSITQTTPKSKYVSVRSITKYTTVVTKTSGNVVTYRIGDPEFDASYHSLMPGKYTYTAKVTANYRNPVTYETTKVSAKSKKTTAKARNKLMLMSINVSPTTFRPKGNKVAFVGGVTGSLNAQGNKVTIYKKW